MSNVISLEQYRSKTQRMDEEAAAKAAEAGHKTFEQLSVMPYAALLDWARVDFERLLVVAHVKDYRPEWIVNQLLNHGVEPTPAQAATLSQMIADAGPYLSRRERWVLRQVRAGHSTQSKLVKLAAGAAEYRGMKRVDLCVANDLAKLVEHGLIRGRGAAGGSGGAAQAHITVSA